MFFNLFKSKEKSGSTNKKRINEKTGYQMSTDKQINVAKEKVELLKKYKPVDNEFFTDEMRYSNKVIDFVLPHYNKGDYYYKTGEWDKAENEWLMILKLMGHFPTIKLAIMYRKQKRFSDEVELLKLSQIYARKNTVYPGTKVINERIPKAEKFREKHINEDKSIPFDCINFRNFPGLSVTSILTQNTLFSFL